MGLGDRACGRATRLIFILFLNDLAVRYFDYCTPHTRAATASMIINGTINTGPRYKYFALRG